ncbi:hypothetical protein GGR53DRAFT_259423 [Hypoxylon sp. FL1150]|nr:hypothetical protein GGR53DRAFT_259423 [Hypoxylon sp. FL1150]
MAKISRTMRLGGKLFVHMFTHKPTLYDYEEGWMTTYFFTGGISTHSRLILIGEECYMRNLLIGVYSAVGRPITLLPERPKSSSRPKGNHYSETWEVSNFKTPRFPLSQSVFWPPAD